MVVLLLVAVEPNKNLFNSFVFYLRLRHTESHSAFHFMFGVAITTLINCGGKSQFFKLFYREGKAHRFGSYET